MGLHGLRRMCFNSDSDHGKRVDNGNNGHICLNNSYDDHDHPHVGRLQKLVCWQHQAVGEEVQVGGMCGVSRVQCAAASGQSLSTISHHGVDGATFPERGGRSFLCTDQPVP